jgi:hypothetical protein
VCVFYSREHGDWIVEEMCECGHLKREHGSNLLPLGNGRKLRVPNGGNCCANSCDCPRFTWDRFVTISEFIRDHLPENVDELVEM